MLKKIGLSTAALLAAMAFVQAPSALAAGRDDFRARNDYSPSYSSGYRDDARHTIIGTRIATTIATFRNLAILDSTDASSTTFRNGDRTCPVTAITTAIAANSRCARRAARGQSGN